MNYKLGFYDELFKTLINIHLVNGNDFDGFKYVDIGTGAFIQLERLDYEDSTSSIFLRYTFKSPEGGSVSYCVNNNKSGGLDICISLVRDTDDYIHLLSEPNPRAEQIMLQCYLFAVKQMATIWYN